MGVVTKLTKPLPGEEKVSVHDFQAACGEYFRKAPNFDLQKILGAFGFDQRDIEILQKFLDNLDQGKITSAEVHDVLLLGESGIYSPEECMDRLQLVEK